MPMRPPVGRGYAPDTRAVSKAVAPMANACDPRTKVRTKSRRGRRPDLRDLSLMLVRDGHASGRSAGLRPRHPRRTRSSYADGERVRNANPKPEQEPAEIGDAQGGSPGTNAHLVGRVVHDK